MKRLVVILVVIGCCGAVAFAAPTINVDSPVYAVTVQSGSRVTHSFVLTNAGDETLTISNVRTSCGCTTAALAKHELAPGESVSIEATVNTTGFHGTVTRTISVPSNDPDMPTAVLRIDVTIADVGPVVPEISAGDLRLRYVVLIDVRLPEEYAIGHLFGAMNVPLSEIRTDAATWSSRLPREVPVVVYGTASADGLEAGTLLARAGVPNVASLAGGITEWAQQFGDGTLSAP